MEYKIILSNQALKDLKKVSKSNLFKKVEELFAILKKDPFQTPPPFKKLQGESKECYARRINIQHRLVFEVFEEQRIVKVVHLWTHYENI